jgi:hypothetical protein
VKDSTFSYQVTNTGNVDLSSLKLKILVVALESGVVAQTLTDQVSLPKGQSFSNSKIFNSTGTKAGDYLAILQGESSGTTQTIAAAAISIVNQAPVAKCKNVTVTPGNNCQATVTASQVDNGSSDPDGDPISLSLNPAGPYLPGTTPVTLTVTDDKGASASCTANVTVVDEAGPKVISSITQKTLWLPNHNMIDVGLSFTATDFCDTKPSISIGVTSDEPADDDTGDGNFSPDARFIRNALGEIIGLSLRAERKGDGDGRVYLITVKATDKSGNVTVACHAVTVAQSQSKASESSVAAQAAAALAACPAGLPYKVLGPPPDGPAPEIGSKQ